MTNSSLLKMVIYSGFTHWTWWFSIVMLVYQRVKILGTSTVLRCCHEETYWSNRHIGNHWKILDLRKLELDAQQDLTGRFYHGKNNNQFCGQTINNISKNCSMMINLQCKVTTWNTSKLWTTYQNGHKSTATISVYPPRFGPRFGFRIVKLPGLVDV